VGDIEIYSKQWCAYCAKAKALFKSKHLVYRETDVTYDEALQREMIARSGRRSVPEIFVDGQLVGGYDDLAYFNATGELDRVLGLREVVDLTQICDVAIGGGGPAGLAAAMYAARKNLSTIVVATDIGGQLGATCRSPARNSSPAAAWCTAPPATGRSSRTSRSPSWAAATRPSRRPSR
jgi:alkyl hydroperoxide reductase subunit F